MSEMIKLDTQTDRDEWDEITAVESPRALTPQPGEIKAKKRSGEYAAAPKSGPPLKGPVPLVPSQKRDPKVGRY
jgi:hypothetical protein